MAGANGVHGPWSYESGSWTGCVTAVVDRVTVSDKRGLVCAGPWEVACNAEQPLAPTRTRRREAPQVPGRAPATWFWHSIGVEVGAAGRRDGLGP